MNLTLLLEMASGLGDRVVVGSRNGGMSAERLRDLARGGARVIKDAGADGLLFLGVNGPAFPVALFAAAYAGVPLIPVNYRLSPEQLARLLINHKSAFAIAEHCWSDLIENAGIPLCSPEEWLDLAARQSGLDMAAQSPADLAAIIYTSGTTSTPKGVMLRHSNLASYVLKTVEFAAADRDDAALVSVPPYHVAGVMSVITNLYAGRRTVSIDNFTPSRWLETVRGEGVTNAMVVPTMLARIMNLDGEDRSVPTLRTLAYGGAKMPQRVIESALREWPHVDFVNAYGLTETSSTVTVLGPIDHRVALTSNDPAVRFRLSSAGRAVPGIEIEVRDKQGIAVRHGVQGHIWVRGGQVSGEYLGTGTNIDERGFFFTRDEGRMDSDGYLFVEGRIDDTIVRGGENIAPAEIEDVLMRHPDVNDAVVVGIPDEEWGQRVEAAVVARTGSSITSNELREFVRSRVRSSKTPDRIEFWDELPRSALGKILRREVVSAMTPIPQESADSAGGRRTPDSEVRAAAETRLPR